MLEFAVVALPLLLAGMAALEAARWFTVRQVAALALHEAARAAAVGHGDPRILQDAFEQALRPLFVPPGPHGSPAARMQAASASLHARTGLAPWHIDILGPPAAAHRDFAQPGLAPDGSPAISNDYLAEQHQRALARGWPQGRGPASGMTIHEANVLHLRLVYLHAPSVPGMAALLRALPAPAGGGYRAQAQAAGLLPIALETRMTMQSHPVLWARGTERVGSNAGGAGTGPSSGAIPPAGWTSDWITPLTPAPGGSAPQPPLDVIEPPSQHAPGGGIADDPLCGVVLCCV